MPTEQTTPELDYSLPAQEALQHITLEVLYQAFKQRYQQEEQAYLENAWRGNAGR